MKARVPDKEDWVMDYFPRKRRARIRRILRRPALWFYLGLAAGAVLAGVAVPLIIS